jgi:hypothetical protein
MDGLFSDPVRRNMGKIKVAAKLPAAPTLPRGATARSREKIELGRGLTPINADKTGVFHQRLSVFIGGPYSFLAPPGAAPTPGEGDRTLKTLEVTWTL